jgi:hypothetical protein
MYIYTRIHVYIYTYIYISIVYIQANRTGWLLVDPAPKTGPVFGGLPVSLSPCLWGTAPPPKTGQANRTGWLLVDPPPKTGQANRTGWLLVDPPPKTGQPNRAGWLLVDPPPKTGQANRTAWLLVDPPPKSRRGRTERGKARKQTEKGQERTGDIKEAGGRKERKDKGEGLPTCGEILPQSQNRKNVPNHAKSQFGIQM